MNYPLSLVKYAMAEEVLKQYEMKLNLLVSLYLDEIPYSSEWSETFFNDAIVIENKTY